MSITIPHTFNDGDLIVASQVNANFAGMEISSAPQTISSNTAWSTPMYVASGGFVLLVAPQELGLAKVICKGRYNDLIH